MASERMQSIVVALRPVGEWIDGVARNLWMEYEDAEQSCGAGGRWCPRDALQSKDFVRSGNLSLDFGSKR